MSERADASGKTDPNLLPFRAVFGLTNLPWLCHSPGFWGGGDWFAGHLWVRSSDTPEEPDHDGCSVIHTPPPTCTPTASAPVRLLRMPGRGNAPPAKRALVQAEPAPVSVVFPTGHGLKGGGGGGGGASKNFENGVRGGGGSPDGHRSNTVPILSRDMFLFPSLLLRNSGAGVQLFPQHTGPRMTRDVAIILKYDALCPSDVLERPYTVGGGEVPPPPPLPMFEADSQNFASAPSVPRGCTLNNFRPAFGGDHRETQGGGVSQPKPLPPPPLLIAAKHCCICIPGRACVKRFVTCLWPLLIHPCGAPPPPPRRAFKGRAVDATGAAGCNCEQ